MGNIGYYLGNNAGQVLYFNSAYTADITTAITGQYVSKQLDFLDQLPQLLDRNKAIYGVKLTYVDRGVITVTVSISTDGGSTWTNNAKAIGTAGAPKTIKTQDFEFVVPGEHFNIKVVHALTTGTFEWLQLELEVRDIGENFTI